MWCECVAGASRSVLWGGVVVWWVLVVVGGFGFCERVDNHRPCSVCLGMYVVCVLLFGLR